MPDDLERDFPALARLLRERLPKPAPRPHPTVVGIDEVTALGPQGGLPELPESFNRYRKSNWKCPRCRTEHELPGYCPRCNYGAPRPLLRHPIAQEENG